MNSFERYIGMVTGTKVDYVPRIPILMHFAAKYVNKSYAEFASNYNIMFEANKKLVEDFGIDQLDIMSDPWREMTAFGGQIEYMDETVPRCIKHPLQDTKNLKLLLKPNPLQSSRLVSAIKTIDEYKKYGWKKYSITGWVEGPAAEAADLRGVENFLIDLIDDKCFISELMAICVNAAVEFACVQIEHGCDTIGIGDAIASQVSAGLYSELILPQQKKLVSGIHKKGGLARLHICGNINHLLPYIAELEIDIIDCDWMVDIEKARKILDPKVTLAGNIDPVKDVMNSTPVKIKNAFRGIYSKVGNPYFVNAGCEIPRDTPIENLKALCAPILAE